MNKLIKAKITSTPCDLIPLNEECLLWVDEQEYPVHLEITSETVYVSIWIYGRFDQKNTKYEEIK